MLELINNESGMVKEDVKIDDKNKEMIKFDKALVVIERLINDYPDLI